MKTKSQIMSRAWEIARSAASKYGGKASSYFYYKTPEGKSENALSIAYEEARIGRERIPDDELPVVPYYYDLQGTDLVSYATMLKYGSRSFWMKNGGKGNAGEDDIDLAEINRELVDGEDISVQEFAERYVYVVRRKFPAAQYDEQENYFYIPVKD